MWRDTMRGWRAFGLVFFILIAVFEFAEVVGDLLGFFDLPAYAELSGIPPEMEYQRLMSLVILSAAITIAAGATAYGIWRIKSWTVVAGTVMGIVAVMYMGYQILSALSVLTVNVYAVIGAASTIGIFGLLGILLVRLAMREVK